MDFITGTGVSGTGMSVPIGTIINRCVGGVIILMFSLFLCRRREKKIYQKTFSVPVREM